MKIVLFADFFANSNGLLQAQYVLRQLCNDGHQITLFECTTAPFPVLVYEEPQASMCELYEEPRNMLEKKIKQADAILLVTDKSSFELPYSLEPMRHLLAGSNYVWRPYGVNCVLLGGSVHNRKVAMQLRALLEVSDYPYMAGVLPERCSWHEVYAVDPSLETPGPCVL